MIRVLGSDRTVVHIKVDHYIITRIQLPLIKLDCFMGDTLELHITFGTVLDESSHSLHVGGYISTITTATTPEKSSLS